MKIPQTKSYMVWAIIGLTALIGCGEENESPYDEEKDYGVADALAPQSGSQPDSDGEIQISVPIQTSEAPTDANGNSPDAVETESASGSEETDTGDSETGAPIIIEDDPKTKTVQQNQTHRS